MKNINDLTAALLKCAGEAADGKADGEQVQNLCLCVETIIKLARLELEARAMFRDAPQIGIEWMDVGKVAALDGSKISALEAEIAGKQRELKLPGISSGSVNSINREISSLTEKLNFLKSTKK